MFPTSFLNLKIGEKAIRKSIILMKWERDFQWEDEFGEVADDADSDLVLTCA